MKRPSYTQKMNTLRPFVSFDFKHPENLSYRNKVKITRHFKVLDEIRKNESFKIIDPPKGAVFERVQEDVNPTFRTIRQRVRSRKVKGKTFIRHYESDFKVLFVPFKEVETTAVFDPSKRKWILKEGGQLKDTIELFKHEADGSLSPGQDFDAFNQDPKAHVDRLVASYPEGTQFKIFNPQDWVDESAHDKASIGEHVASRVNYYANPQTAGANLEPKGENWIYGLQAILPAPVEEVKEDKPVKKSKGRKNGRRKKA